MRDGVGRPVRLVAGMAALLLLTTAAPSLASHGDIHARCPSGVPVISERPPGTEHLQVICVGGLPEFLVNPTPTPLYDPVTSTGPQATPPDFGGWVTVWLNDRPLKTPYDPIRALQEPGAYLTASSGRVMMPVRFFTAAFGGGVEWHQEKRRVRLFLKDRVVQLWLGERDALVNGLIITLDQPPVVFADRVFVPVRFLLESFDATVAWDAFHRSARIRMNGAECLHSVYCGEVR